MIDLTDYGFISTIEKEGFISGRVIEVQRGLYRIICDHGEGIAKVSEKLRRVLLVEQALRMGKSADDWRQIHEVSIAGSFPVIGDFVHMLNTSADEYQIYDIAERKSVFYRTNNTGHVEGYVKTAVPQAIAANFDYVFIMASLNCDFNVKRIERYLTVAWQSGAVPVVVLTKADLVEDYTEQIREVNQIAAGVGVFAVSAKTGYGLDELSGYLKPRKTIVFLGSSGVGKSSLVNTLARRAGHTEDVMAVNEIREDDSKGRHTTTHRQLIMLKNGVMIIDTPGMRELGMWDVSVGLGQSFSDVEQYFGKCKFNDCKHQSEPGCAVKAAIESGELSQDRWNSYLNLKHEAKYSDDKESYLRKKQEKFKSIAINSKNIKKNGGFKK